MKLLARLAFVLLLALPVFAQEGDLDKAQPKSITPEEIITRFSTKEKEFKGGAR